MKLMFGRDVASLSRAYNLAMLKIYRQFGHLLTPKVLLTARWRACVLNWVAAFAQLGCPTPACFGFVDGTAVRTCRPNPNQHRGLLDLDRANYSGYYRSHGMKFLVVILACGLQLFVGPESIRRGDAHIYHNSGLEGVLMALSALLGVVVRMYGDSAFPLSDVLWCPFPNFRRLQPELRQFNKKMAALRSANEMGIGKVARYFAFMDFKKNQRLFQQAVPLSYFVSGLFTNIHTCYYGSNMNATWHTEAPDIDWYLGLNWREFMDQ